MSDERMIFASPFSGQIYTKAVNGAAQGQRVVSVLTYPTKDYAGDIIRPDGGDWSQYPNHNYVNWSHRCPIGRGSVNHRVLKYNEQTSPVAVGETQFLYTKADVDGLDLRRRDPRTHRPWNKEAPYTVDEVLKAAAQAERLVRDEIATGVSIEFDVDMRKKGQDWWDLSEMSLLENRPARHFENWRGLGYAHARNPVNPGCMTLAGQPRLTPKTETIEKAIRIAQTGKLPGGEPLCPIILKSFDDLANYRSPNVSVLVEGTPPTAAADTNAVTVKGDVQEGVSTTNDTQTSAGPKMGAGHRALMNAVQGINDICNNLENEAGESDDLSIRKFCKKVCSWLKDKAGDIKARAEKHKAKLDKGSAGETDDDDDNPMDEDDYEPSTEEKAIEVDADGAIITKAFPDWKPRRMTFDNIVDSGTVEVKGNTPEQDGKEAPDPELVAEEKRALKRLRKMMKEVQPLIDAAVANGLLPMPN